MDDLILPGLFCCYYLSNEGARLDFITRLSLKSIPVLKSHHCALR